MHLKRQMGVGKTLTSIATIWAFVRRGGRKCLVICPSSLVDNWLKEVKHWLGTKLKPLALRPGADAAAVINTFAISMASLYPVMILSYEVRGPARV
jgi:DNA repair and recombination RAD54-like protein